MGKIKGSKQKGKMGVMRYILRHNIFSLGLA